MMHTLATLFMHPIRLGGWQETVMLLPLCAAIALVYKSIKCDNAREVPVASLILWVTVVAGMYAVGLGLWGLYRIVV